MTVVILVLLVLLAGLITVPKARNVALNLAHVRGTATIIVIDSTNHGPLRDASVQLGNQQATTNASGRVTIKNLRLGSQTLRVQKSAYAPLSRSVSISWGTNELGNVSLQALGTQYNFVVTDYVSGQPITNAAITAGTSVSQGNAQGRVNAVVPASSTTATVSAPGYRSIKISLPPAAGSPVTIALVPNQQDIYVSRSGGKFNVYGVAVDGQPPHLLLAGTGTETSHMDVVPSEDGSQVAVVSTRDNVRDKAGYLLDTLTLVQLNSAKATTLAHAQQIKIVGWVAGGRLIYTALKANATSSDPARYQLLVYDKATNKQTELDHANNFNDVVLANGTIYYATSNHSSGGSSQLLKIAPDGSGKQTLLGSEVTSILRTDHNDFVLATAGTWYSLKLGSAKPTATNTTASSSRLYVDSPDSGTHSAWVDQQNGKLYLYTKSSAKESVLAQQSGLVYPIRWLNSNIIVYRVSTTVGVWDYAVSIHGGTPKKIISGVLDLNGLTLWHD